MPTDDLMDYLKQLNSTSKPSNPIPAAPTVGLPAGTSTANAPSPSLTEDDSNNQNVPLPSGGGYEQPELEQESNTGGSLVASYRPISKEDRQALQLPEKDEFHSKQDKIVEDEVQALIDRGYVLKSEPPPSLLDKSLGAMSSFLGQFQRGHNAVTQVLSDNIDQFKDEYEKASNEPDVASKLKAMWQEDYQAILDHPAREFESLVTGFKEDPSEAPQARDLVNKMVGTDKVDALDDWFKTNFEPHTWGASVASKLPLTEDHKSEVANVLDTTLFNPTNLNATTYLADKAMQHAVGAPMLAADIALDPLSYVPFGAVSDLAKTATKNTMLGALWGVSKISEPLAYDVYKAVDKLGDKMAAARSWYNPAWGAKNAIKNYYLDEYGIDMTPEMAEGMANDTVSNVREFFNHAKDSNQDFLKWLAQDGPVRANRGVLRSVFRSTIGKVADATGFEPQSFLTKYLTGQDDEVAATHLLGKVLAQVNDSTDALVPSLLADSASKLTNLSGMSEEEASQVQQALTAHLKAGERSSISVAAGENVNDQINRKYAQDLKSLLTKGQKDAVETSQNISDLRHEDRVGQLNDRYDLIKEASDRGKEEFDNVQKESKQQIKQAVREERMKALEELKQRKSDFREDVKQTVQAHKNALADLEHKYERLYDYRFKELDPEASDFKSQVKSLREEMRADYAEEAKRHLNTIDAMKQAYPQAMAKIEQRVSEKLDASIVKRTAAIQHNLSEKTASLRASFPTKQALDDLYDKSLAQLEKTRNQETAAFKKQIEKIKFVQVHNDMVEANQQLFQDILEEHMDRAELPDNAKNVLRRARESLDAIGADMVQKKKLSTLIPNYFTRMVQKPEGGLYVVVPEDFGKSLQMSGGISGIGARAMERTMGTYQAFVESVEARGGKSIDDIYQVMHNVDLANRLDSAYTNTIAHLPNELKAGKLGTQVNRYIKYLYEGRNTSKNAILAPISRAMSTYSYYNKMLLTLPFPSFWFKHIGGMPLLTVQNAGMASLGNGLKSLPEWMALKAGTLESVTNAAGETKTAEEIFKAFKDYGVGQSAFLRGDIEARTAQMLNRYNKTDPRYWVTAGLKQSQEAQDYMRGMGAYNFWKEGKSLKDAARQAKNVFYDYSDMTPVDKAMGGIMGFWAFRSKNLSAGMKAMINDPKQLAIIGHFVNAMSTGKKPDQESMAYMSDFDRDKAIIFGDVFNGVQATWEMGFTPWEETYSTVAPLLRGGNFVRNWLGDTIANQLNPGLSLAVNTLVHAGDGHWANKVDAHDGYIPLPQTYADLSEDQLGALNKVSNFFGQGNIQVVNNHAYENGELAPRRFIYVPTPVYHAMTSGPAGRGLKEYYQLYDAYSKDTGDDEGLPAAIQMLKSGHLSTGDALIHYLTGASPKAEDYEKQKASFTRKNREIIHDQAVAHQLSGDIPYVKKSTKKELRDERMDE